MCSALGRSGQLCPAEDLGGCVCVCVWTFVCLHKLLSICLPGGLRLWTKGGSENLTQPLGCFSSPSVPATRTPDWKVQVSSLRLEVGPPSVRSCLQAEDPPHSRSHTHSLHEAASSPVRRSSLQGSGPSSGPTLSWGGVEGRGKERRQGEQGRLWPVWNRGQALFPEGPVQTEEGGLGTSS